MDKVLVGRSVDGVRFEKAAIFHVRKNGRLYAIPERFLGSIETCFARKGVAFLKAEPAANFIDYSISEGSTVYRISMVE